MLVKMMAKIIS